MKLIDKLLKAREEIRAIGMTRADAEEIAYGIVDKLPRKARRSAERKIRNSRRKK